MSRIAICMSVDYYAHACKINIEVSIYITFMHNISFHVLSSILHYSYEFKQYTS